MTTDYSNNEVSSARGTQAWRTKDDRYAFDLDYTVDALLRMLAIPSPTGFTDAAIEMVEGELKGMGVDFYRTRKGNLVWKIAGKQDDDCVTFSGHIDTLGLMVKGIKGSGRLGLSLLGGFDWATIEGEDVQVHTQSGRVVTGTVLNTKQSTHVHGPELRDLKRTKQNMEVRLDERTFSAEDTRALGIEVGDFVSLEAHPRLTESGFVKSRHIDNKAAVAIFLGMTKRLLEQQPERSVAFHVTTYEEVGHGAASGIPECTGELIAVDMAAVGEGQTSSEYHCTLCVADSGGPYSHGLSNSLRRVAQAAGLKLKVDIYPYYASDGTAAWRAGGDYPVALIGPGVDASHSYERTHVDALEDTGRLMLAYVMR